jgi:uncharacterized protein YdcH (DUF465 family)
MNILNYIDSKNQEVAYSAKQIRSDLTTINSFLTLVNSNDHKSYINIENKINQSGGAPTVSDVVILVDGTSNFILDDTKKTVTIQPSFFSSGKTLKDKSTINVLSDTDTNKNYTNYKSYQTLKDTNVYVYFATENGVVVDLKILQPSSQRKDLTDLLPSQFQVDDALKLKLYKSLAILDEKKSYASKFAKLVEKVNKLDSRVTTVKVELTKQFNDSNSNLTKKYASKVDEYLTKIQASINSSSTSYNELKDKLKTVNESVTGLEQIAGITPPAQDKPK